MKSLTTKFTLAISLLVSMVLVVNAIYLENQQRRELKSEIVEQAISYAELGHTTIGESYSLYYESGFLNLSNTIKSQFKLNSDAVRLQLINYNGEILFDDLDEQPRYMISNNGEKEFVPKYLLPKVQGRFDADPNNEVSDTVNEVVLSANEIQNLKLKPILVGQPILEIIYPYYDNNQRHVVTLRYLFSFEGLQAAITRMRMTVAGLTLLGILAGIMMTILLVRTIVQPIRALTNATKRIAAGDFHLSIETKSRDEVGRLADSFNTMAGKLDKTTKELAEKEVIAKEVELASKIQTDTLPKEMPSIEGVTLATSLTPATFVGGDCYDFIQTPDGKTIFYIGDATGHGVPAGIVISLLNAVIFDHARNGLPLLDIIKRANEVVRRKTSGHTFATALILQWDPETSSLEFISAGHQPLMHYQHKDGLVTLKKENPGMPIGSMLELNNMLKSEIIQLTDGDAILVYSDGLVEARNRSGEMWGTVNLEQSLGKCAKIGACASDIQAGILKDCLAFREGVSAEDDITIITLRKGQALYPS